MPKRGAFLAPVWTRCGWVACVIVSVASTLLVPGWAEADGGAVILSRAPAGPYHVSVWVEPSPPRSGIVDLSVAIMKPETGRPALGTDVQVSVTSPRGAHSTASLERGAGGNLLIHHGNLDLGEPGRWRFLLEVVGPAGSGASAFELNAIPSAGWTRIAAWVAALLAVVIAPILFAAGRRSWANGRS